jgi:SAM-dependent methyltransferase
MMGQVQPSQRHGLRAWPADQRDERPIRSASGPWAEAGGNGRILRPEILADSDDRSAAANLRDLARINRWLGAQRVAMRLLAEHAGWAENFSLLDVGAASGDLGAAVQARFPQARVVSVDRQVRNLRGAAQPKLAADAFALPFRPGEFDFVYCSLLLHEYPDAEVRQLLRGLWRLAGRALIALDLFRHPLAYHFLPATRWLFRWHEVTAHDGPASVAAAFRPDELRRLAARAGLRQTRVRVHWPWFRVSLVAWR